MDDHNPHYQAAIQAGATRLHATCEGRGNVTQHGPEAHEHTARVVVDAALPHLGEHIADAIETIAEGVTGSSTYRRAYIDALRRSAGITRYVTQPHTHTGPADDADTRTYVDGWRPDDLTHPIRDA